MNMIIFAGPKLEFRPQKTGFAPKFSSDIRSAAGELFTGPHQSLPELSDGHWGTLETISGSDDFMGHRQTMHSHARSHIMRCLISA